MAQESVETAVYRLRVEGQDQIDQLTKSIGDLTVAEEKATSQNRTTSDDLQKRIARYDPLIRAQRAYSEELQRIAGYQETGVGTQQEINALMDGATRKYENQTKAINDAAVATEHLRRAQANAAAGPGQAVQAAGGTEAYAAQFAAAAKAQDEQVASINRLRSAINPLEAEQGKLGTQMANYRKLLQDGKITQTEYAAAQDMAATSLRRSNGATIDLAEAHKGLNAQGQAAFHSIRSMVEMLLMGMSPTQALTSQINHLAYAASAEGGLAGAFKQAGGMIGSMIETAKGFLSPANLVIGTIVGMGAAIVTTAVKFASAQKEIERSLIGIGGQSGATIAKINAFAQIGPQQSLTGMSIGEKREAGTTFAQAGVDVSKLKGVEDAIRGYAIVAGTDATKATKDLAAALGGDLVKAVDELQKVYGALDPTLRDTVQAMLLINDKAAAQRAIMDAVAAANKRALDTITPLSAGWSGLINIAQMVGEGWLKILSYKVFETPGQKAAQAAKEAAAAAAAAQQQANEIQNKGRAVVDTYEPEIKQVDKLKQDLADLIRAKEAAAAAGKTFDDGGAEQKIRNTIAATNEAHAASVAWQQTIARVSAEWQGVSQSAAMALHAQEAQLPVIEAIGGAAKMAAQYTLDFNTTMEKSGNATEATAVASMNLKTAMAQVNAAAQETLFTLQNQADAVGAVTAAEQMAAQATATRNQLLHDGVDQLLAQQVAAQQLANAQAAANASVERQTNSVKDQTELVKVQGTSAERRVRAEQAEKAATEAGADAAKARAAYDATWDLETAKASANLRDAASHTKQISADMSQIADAAGNFDLVGGSLMNAMKKIADDAERIAPAIEAANRGIAEAAERLKAGYDQFAPRVMPSGTLTLGGGAQVSYRGGGMGKNLGLGPVNIEAAMLENQKAMAEFAASFTPEGQLKAFELELARAQASRDVGGQLVALRGELGYVQGLPQSTENYQKIASLQGAIDNLTKSTDTLSSSTDSLNATNKELLSPYYTQDPRTSHIGFRSQGMALGGYVDVPGGISSNDNMIATIPVSSGERIYIDPMNNRRGTSSGSGTTINISSPITINGNANADQFGRTLYQANQQLAKQVRAATQ